MSHIFPCFSHLSCGASEAGGESTSPVLGLLLQCFTGNACQRLRSRDLVRKKTPGMDGLLGVAGISINGIQNGWFIAEIPSKWMIMKNDIMDMKPHSLRETHRKKHTHLSLLFMYLRKGSPTKPGPPPLWPWRLATPGTWRLQPLETWGLW